MKEYFAKLIKPKAEELKELLNENKPADEFLDFIRGKENAN